VCSHLSLLDAGLLDEQELGLGGEGQPELEPVPAAECRELLQRHFYGPLEGPVPSFNTLRVFLGVLGDQLRKFSEVRRICASLS
jgi:hypothetical protein